MGHPITSLLKVVWHYELTFISNSSFKEKQFLCIESDTITQKQRQHYFNLVCSNCKVISDRRGRNAGYSTKAIPHRKVGAILPEVI